jgi:hypothetical protein
VLSIFPDGEKFNVPRFMWVQLSYAMDDGKRDLTYAPYLMFMIERVSGFRYHKDCVHQVYKIKKTKGGMTQAPRVMSPAHEDLFEGSRSRDRR